MTAKKKVKAKAPKVEEKDAKVGALEARLDRLEARQTILVDSIQFVADQARPMYGLTPIAMIFDAVYEKLTK